MKTYCIKDILTGFIFKIFVTEEGFQKYINENPDMKECVKCVECEDAPSITLE